MKCERCFSFRRGRARYRAYTDAMDIEVCPSCAEEAREVGIKVELLDGAKRTFPRLCKARENEMMVFNADMPKALRKGLY